VRGEVQLVNDGCSDVLWGYLGHRKMTKLLCEPKHLPALSLATPENHIFSVTFYSVTDIHT
jgi:hypothetical protein